MNAAGSIVGKGKSHEKKNFDNKQMGMNCALAAASLSELCTVLIVNYDFVFVILRNNLFTANPF
jgi:hypothetical protein